MLTDSVPVTPLGQVGFRLQFGNTVVYVDPYLSDSVREQEAADLERLIRIPFPPESVNDADYVLITHEHRDHCDPETLAPLAAASPQAVFIGPRRVTDRLAALGIGQDRLRTCKRGRSLALAPDLTLDPVPSAHPEIEQDADGNWHYLGYLLRWRGRLLYHAGDTALTEDLYRHLESAGRIDVAFLPVNEINFFRNRRGIIGNMSIREAFGLAEELGIRTVVPTHWDMFAANQVYREEIELLYHKLSPTFQLALSPNRV